MNNMSEHDLVEERESNKPMNGVIDITEMRFCVRSLLWLRRILETRAINGLVGCIWTGGMQRFCLQGRGHAAGWNFI